MTQSASGSVSVSWERPRVSTAVRVRKPRDKRLFFMGLCWLGVIRVGLRKAFCTKGALHMRRGP